MGQWLFPQYLGELLHLGARFEDDRGLVCVPVFEIRHCFSEAYHMCAHSHDWLPDVVAGEEVGVGRVQPCISPSMPDSLVTASASAVSSFVSGSAVATSPDTSGELSELYFGVSVCSGSSWVTRI